jgi:hypothetical protein
MPGGQRENPDTRRAAARAKVPEDTPDPLTLFD